jgi:hypothetical protein
MSEAPSSVEGGIKSSVKDGLLMPLVTLLVSLSRYVMSSGRSGG